MLESRRAFLQKSLAAALLGRSVLAGAAAVQQCTPVISGNLWWYHPDSYTHDEWRKMLLEQKTLGFDLLWLSNITSAVDTKAHRAQLSALLDDCAELGFEVILDTGFSSNWYGRCDVAYELDHCGKVIDAIAEAFGDHPAFFAWYIPHEIYMCWDEFAAFIDQLYPALVQRAKAAVDKPVTLSPFFILDRDKIFGDFEYNEPAAYEAYWTRLIKRSGIDIIMLQDSGEHFSYVTMAQRRPFFEAMQKACQVSGATLWGNVEVAEFHCESLERYEELYGRVHHSTVKDAPWRAVPIPRLEQKLALAAEYSERIVCWGYQQYGTPSLGAAAKAWCGDYQRYYERMTKTKK